MSEADSVTLRPWSPDDAAALLTAALVSDLDRQVLLDSNDLAGATAWIERRATRDPEQFRSFVIDRDGVLVGEVGLHAIDHRHAVATIGYWLVPEARGVGIATRATHTLVTWAFDELDIERMSLDHRVNNPESGRVALRCGFTVEGVQRARLRYEDVRYDVATYGLLGTDARPAIESLPIRG